MRPRWVVTVRSRTPRRVAIWRAVRPSAATLRTSRSRSVRVVSTSRRRSIPSAIAPTHSGGGPASTIAPQGGHRRDGAGRSSDRVGGVDRGGDRAPSAGGDDPHRSGTRGSHGCGRRPHGPSDRLAPGRARAHGDDSPGPHLQQARCGDPSRRHPAGHRCRPRLRWGARVVAVASLSGEDWRSVARRLVPFALLVVAVVPRVEEVSLLLRKFESGQTVSRATYLPRFTEIAAAEGRAYRDFPVEYPPVALGAIELVAGTNANETGANLVWLMVLFDLVTAVALGIGWGRRAAVFYLLLTVPLLAFLYTTIDLISVALAVSAVALVVRGRERLGGVALAAAVLAKVWPVALVPMMVAQRKRRALAWSVGALALGTLVWAWWGGPSGLLTRRPR